jgi:hypothetical protein
MKKSDASQGQSASELISNRIAELGDWRGETLGRMRRLIQEADRRRRGSSRMVTQIGWPLPKRLHGHSHLFKYFFGKLLLARRGSGKTGVLSV